MEGIHPILVVDADPMRRAKIVECLAARGLQCSETATAREALEACRESVPELIIFELALPDMTGFGLCRLIREQPELAGIALVVVSRCSQEIDRILAFENGVDDFVPSPFFSSELGARVQSILNARTACRSPAASIGGREPLVRTDPRSRTAYVGDRRVDLSTTEFELLGALMQEAGRVVARRQLIATVWGQSHYPSERAIDSHVKMIRRKLGQAGSMVETVRGKGYRFSDRKCG